VTELLQAVVADALPLVRLGVAAVLEPLGVEVIAETHSGRVAAEQAGYALADLVVVGEVADGTTLDAIRRIREVQPPPRTIALLARAGDGAAAAALALGAAGLALRTGPLDELAAVVVSVVKDEPAVVASLQTGLAGAFASPGEAAPVPVGLAAAGLLSAREREMLGFLAQGRSNREIAATLSLSLATVKSHLVHLYAKLGVRNRNEALTRAVTLGLLR
jgi:DNA-binding NarL/FixJ family response regulator